MVKSQILTGNVLDPRILDALRSVEREAFVPASYQAAAYVDEEIPLAKGRFLAEPLDFARLLKHAAIAADETILDIGTGTGYSAAVLSKLARKVVAIEDEPALAESAAKLLASYPNVSFRATSLLHGTAEFAPYDAILIEGAVEYLPQPVADQLREGGRLLTAEHDAEARVGAVGLSKLVEYRKIRGILYKTTLRDANMALLPAFRKPAVFAF